MCGPTKTTGGTAVWAADVQDGTSSAPPRAARPAARLPLDQLDGLEGLVHVADGQVEAEVEHGVAGGPLALLQAHKVPQRPPGHHGR